MSRTMFAVPAIAAGLLFWTPAQAARNQATKTQGQTGNATQGEAVYKRQCASCHGADLTGSTAMGKKFNLKSLKSPEVQNMSDEELFNIINKGKGKMPAYANLGHDVIHNLVAYIRSAGKK